MHHYNLELGSHLVNILVTNISCVFVERNSNLNFVETSLLLPDFILLETLGSNEFKPQFCGNICIAAKLYTPRDIGIK